MLKALLEGTVAIANTALLYGALNVIAWFRSVLEQRQKSAIAVCLRVSIIEASLEGEPLLPEFDRPDGVWPLAFASRELGDEPLLVPAAAMHINFVVSMM